MTETSGHPAHPQAGRREPTAADVMRTDVLAVEDTETAGMASELIARVGYHHLPVVRGGRCIGVIDAGSLHTGRLRADLTGHQVRVGDLGIDQPVEVAPEVPLRAIAQRMLQRRTDAVLVRDPADRVVGLITVHDILRAVADTPPQRPPQRWQEQPAMFTIAPVLPVGGQSR
jgi:CBS domain-containing protein